MDIIYLFLAVLVFFILSELLLRILKFGQGYSRKLGHLATGLGVFILSSFVSGQTIITLSVISLVFLVVIKYTELFPMLHKAEAHRPGVAYFPIAVAVSAFLFLPRHLAAFQFGVLVLALSDTAAEIFGKLYGKHKIRFLGDKTWQGTIAFFITTLIIFAAFIYPKHIVNFPNGLLICLVLTMVEAAFSLGLDNLFLPIVAAYLIQVFTMLHK